MLESPDQAEQYARTHHGVLGEGWKEVESFEDLDADEYETDEEVSICLLTWLSDADVTQVEYVTLDLGAAVDPKLLQTATTYQLIVSEQHELS